ncbi:hypothetical protein [Spiroplasma sp. SV19]|uniref:hypothetical protein n=1 Tax=Spiroplasma sp. SV19 TaxID=2570468 RepID=UPI0024B749E0|nr:hypothetical protein [Spiroplasma sp. SV19]WHQ37359.1 hypothetical protein E7Y35_05780 [Spiroplasma sp. SV19]
MNYAKTIKKNKELTTKEDRTNNLEGCYKIREQISQESLLSSKIIIIDDVKTTGATLETLISILLNAGIPSQNIIAVSFSKDYSYDKNFPKFTCDNPNCDGKLTVVLSYKTNNYGQIKLNCMPPGIRKCDTYYKDYKISTYDFIMKHLVNNKKLF